MSDTEKVLRETIALYRSLFNEMNNSFILSEVIYGVDKKPCNYSFLDVNPAFEKFTGLSKEHVIGKKFNEIFPKADLYWYEYFGQVILTEQPARFEGYSKTMGKYLDVIAYMPQKNQLAVIFTDMTERKKMDSALRQSEEKYRTLAEAAEDNIFVINKDDCVEYVNTYAARQLGSRPEEIIGKSRSCLFPSKLSDRQKGYLQKIFETGQPVHTENKDNLKGREVWLSNNLVPLKNETGQVYAVMGVSRDITERKKTEEALRVSEERLKLALEGTNEGLWDWNISTGDSYFSPRYYTMLDYEPDEFPSNYESWISLIHPDDLEETLGKINENFKNKKDYLMIEYRVKSKSGRWKWILGRGKVVEWDKEGKPVRIVGTNIDVTEQKEAEKKLKLSEEKFSKAFNISPDSMTITRLSDGKFLEINQGFTKIHGYTAEEAIGKTSVELNLWAEPSDRERWIKTLNTSGEITGMEFSNRKKDGTPITLLMSAKILDVHGEECILTVARDITERKKLEEQLFQSQKMEAIGQLAGGIAHDFNNILTAILGYATMIKFETESNSLLYEAAITIEKAGLRAAELTRQLLSFARSGKYLNTTVDLNTIVREVITLLSHTLEENITIIQKFNTNEAFVLGDPGQLHQVILNLAVNARDAMPEGGVLTVETDIIYLDEEYCRINLDITSGHYVKFSVIDTGCGIPRDIQDRIFEPFFTTKEQGKGTGMGLAMVYGIIKNHNGAVRVYSEPNYGAAFYIYLPHSEIDTIKKTSEQKGNVIYGRGKILLVDDEELVLLITCRSLKELGYEVITAKDGNEALYYYQKFGSQIDLVIIDLIMPGMSTRDCIRAIKEITPNLPVILSTGYCINGKSREIIDDGCMFIQKPYNINELSRIIVTAMRKRVKFAPFPD